jgi:NADPH2:quinone reductase
MKAVYIKEFGGVEGLEVRDVPELKAPAGNEILVRVRAAGLNRADLLQRRGLYPPPEGYDAQIPGLEFAGEVAVVGESVKNFKVGDRVFGITAGEAQAEFLLIDAGLATKIPDNLSFLDAAAIPEAFITAHDAIFTQANLQSGETLLIHAVGSGVGLAVLQLAKANGVTTVGTSRTADKLERCKEFGLDHAIVASDGKFADEVINATNGVDVILDLVGGAYFSENLKALKTKGRLMLVGLTAGRSSEIDLSIALSKRLTIKGTVLRGRSLAEKADAVNAFARDVVPLLASGAVTGNVDKIFAIDNVRDAHAYLESNESFGKVILEF